MRLADRLLSEGLKQKAGVRLAPQLFTIDVLFRA